MPKNIGGDVILDEKPSREADVVFLTEKNVYKIYSNAEAAWTSYEMYKEAEAAGVPVVSAARFVSLLNDGAASTPIAGIMSARAAGRFFQLSKSGGESRLIEEIGKIIVKPRMERVLAGLESAAAFGVSDAQGFVDIGSDTPLQLIDIHSIGRWRATASNSKKDPDAAFERKRTGAFDQVIDITRSFLARL